MRNVVGWCGRGWRAALAMLLMGVTPTASRAGLDSDVRQVVGGAALNETVASVLIVDLRGGRTLAEIDADRPMVPASAMKLLTTAAALHRLGPEFRFTTRLLLAPPPAGGDTQTPPDLLIEASGDPAFGDPVLLAQAGYEVDDLVRLWVDAVKDTGHSRFGRLRIDDRCFDRVFAHPDWPAAQLDRPSFAQVGGLNFHENVLAVLPVPADAPGQAPVVQVYPLHPALRTLNRATTGATDDFRAKRAADANRFTFLGSVRNRRSQPYRVAVHDPGQTFAEFFAHQLRRAGVEVEAVERVGVGDRVDPRRGTLLHELHTTLPGVLDRTNQDSQNLFAEALLKRMGRELTGAPGSFENGASAVRLFLRDKLAPRVGTSGVRIADGSGLSKNNRVTARVLVEVLRAMHADRELGPIFTASLSEAGHHGTLRRRFDGLDGQVYGKSGWLGASAGYASSLAGYYVAPDGRAYAFAMLFNGFRPPLTHPQVKATQDRVLQALEDELTGR
ncbi:MAG: D-alanyl-D-alanine carboxypeptidase/D-alanyl-D-alanine-endopeptidase [Planctomycetota bacterium]